MILKINALLLFVAAVVANGDVAKRQQAAGDCTDVHIFLARGNGEPYPGQQGVVASDICSGVSGSCDYEDIVYHNAIGVSYCVGSAEAAINGPKQIIEYNARCPDAKLVLSGYSQGGQVISDIMGGSGGKVFECTQKSNVPIDTRIAAAKQIYAVLIFADVRHTANQTYNVETGAGLNGISARPESQLVFIDKFAQAKNLRSYCVETDPICALGSDGVTHTTYFELFSNDAAEWVHQQLKGNGPTYPATPVAPTPTSTTKTFKPTSTSTHSKTGTSSTPTSKPNSASPLQFSESLFGLAVVAALGM